MDVRDRKVGSSGGGDAVARILSLVVILVAAAGAIASLPDKASDVGPPGTRELIGLVGSNMDHAVAILAKRRIHPSHNGEGEFYYASLDGCHAQMRLRLMAVGRMVVGWNKSTDPERACMATEAAIR